MPDYDPLYIVARSVLLDALEALGSQRGAAVVVGAQAVYMQTGDAGIADAPYTTDADLAVSPGQLADEPLLEELMRVADFRQVGNPGAWVKTVALGPDQVDVPVDLMVPAAYVPAGGRRSARIPPHDKLAVRKTLGLEGAVIDNDVMDVAALNGTDPRSFTVRVAGPAALIIAKMYKLRDRLAEGKPDRLADKDAADVYRIMQTISVSTVLARLRPVLADPTAGPPSADAVDVLSDIFGHPNSPGIRMAADALRVELPRETGAAVCTGFVRDLRAALTLELPGPGPQAFAGRPCSRARRCGTVSAR